MSAARKTQGPGRAREQLVLPNFLVIGAARCGTTSLWSYLAQHPEIYLTATKEPNYFAFAEEPPNCAGPADPRLIHELLLKCSVTTWPEYLALFDEWTGQKAVGEASVRYLYVPEAAARIRARLPDVRLIAVLREPVARMYSHYWMNRQFQLEDLELEDAIAAEAERRRAGWGYDWHYVAVGSYAEQLERYFSLFGRERVAVFLQEDLHADPVGVSRQAYRFLGVSDAFEPNVSVRFNETYQPRFLALDRLLHHPNPLRSLGFRLLRATGYEALRKRISGWNSIPVPRLEEGRRKRLKAHFQSDVQRLEQLLGRDLSTWR